MSQTWRLPKNSRASLRPLVSAVARHRGHRGEHPGGRDQGEHSGEEVRRTPARLLPEPGRERHSDHVGDGQAEHHARHRPAPPRRRDQARCDQAGHAEEGAVRQSVKEPCGRQHAVVGSDRADQVEDAVRRHQADQRRSPRQLGTEEREDRDPDDDAEGVRRDHVPGGRHRDVDTVRDLGQHAHGHELGGADRESANGERQDRERGPGGRDDGLVVRVRGDLESVIGQESSACESREGSTKAPSAHSRHRSTHGRTSNPSSSMSM